MTHKTRWARVREGARRAGALRYLEAIGLVVVIGVWSGCRTENEYGDLEVDAGVSVASVPSLLHYSRTVHEPCVRLKGGCTDSDELMLRSATCDAADCTVEPSGNNQLRMIARSAGRHTVRVVAWSGRTQEELTAQTEVEVVDINAVKLQLTVELARTNPAFYTAIAPAGAARVTAKLIEVGTDRTLEWERSSLQWSVKGAEQDKCVLATCTAKNAREGGVEIAATLGAIRSVADVVVQVPRDDDPIRIAFEHEIDPSSIDVPEHVVGQTLYVARERAGHRVPAGADAVRIDGQGCALSSPGEFLPDVASATRDLEVAAGAVCSLIIGGGDAARRIPVRSVIQ